MIVVKNIEGWHRLYCEEDHRFEKLERFEGVDSLIRAGSIGGYVKHLKEGDVVNFWLSENIHLGEHCLLDGVIVETHNKVRAGNIGPHVAMSDSYVRASSIEIQGGHGPSVIVGSVVNVKEEFKSFGATLDGCNIESPSFAAYLSLAENLHTSFNLEIISSTIKDCTWLHDKLEADRRHRDCFVESWFNAAMADNVISIMSSRLEKVYVATNIRNMLVTQSTVIDSAVMCDISIVDSIVRDSEFSGGMAGLLNCWIKRSNIFVRDDMPCRMLDMKLMDQEEVKFGALTIGDIGRRIQG